MGPEGEEPQVESPNIWAAAMSPRAGLEMASLALSGRVPVEKKEVLSG